MILWMILKQNALSDGSYSVVSVDGNNGDCKDESGDEKVKVLITTITITWSGSMTLTSCFPELATDGDSDSLDGSENGDEKVKVELKSESDNYMICVDDIDKLHRADH